MVVLSLVGREEVGPHGEPGVVEAVHGSAVLPCGLEGGSLPVPARELLRQAVGGRLSWMD